MKIKRFKLNALSIEGLRQKEMNAIVGGNSCGCSCYWANQGGSSIDDNNMANYQLNLPYSQHGCSPFTYEDENGALYWPEQIRR